MPIEDCFRAYDIRGKVGEELTPEVMERIGQAFATQLDAATVVVGHDARNDSPDFSAAFARGAAKAGVDVIRTGLVPYGAVLFHGWRHSIPTAYITASHLPPEWNGIKFTDGQGIGYLAEDNTRIKDLYFSQEFSTGNGSIQQENVLDAYRDYLAARADTADTSLVMDCGNGASGVAAPAILRESGAQVDTINEQPDGDFPNRSSDVTDDSLDALKQRVAGGDYACGIAYDGDADRVAVVDETGNLLSAEQAAAVILSQIRPEEKGPIIANVECSRLIEEVAADQERDVIRVRVGHNYMIKALQEHNGCLAVETSRHMSVPHVLPVDDGIAASLALVEAISRLDQPLSAFVADLPAYVRDRIPFTAPEQDKFAVVKQLQDNLSAAYDNTNTRDGIRVDLPEGWILIRASNTSPTIRLTVEAETEDAFHQLKDEFAGRITALL